MANLRTRTPAIQVQTLPLEGPRILRETLFFLLNMYVIPKSLASRERPLASCLGLSLTSRVISSLGIFWGGDFIGETCRFPWCPLIGSFSTRENCGGLRKKIRVPKKPLKKPPHRVIFQLCFRNL